MSSETVTGQKGAGQGASIRQACTAMEAQPRARHHQRQRAICTAATWHSGASNAPISTMATRCTAAGCASSACREPIMALLKRQKPQDWEEGKSVSRPFTPEGQREK